MCHSIGGGTGSGLGSLLLQEVRDAYPNRHLVAAAVCPFDVGETPMSLYNSALALSFLREHCDATLLFDNSQLLRQLSASAAAPSHSSQPAPRICLSELDAYLARGLAGLLFPTEGRAGVQPTDVGELATSLCPAPSLSFLSLHTSPTPAASRGSARASSRETDVSAGTTPWDPIVDSLSNQLPRYDLLSRPVAPLCSLAIARGIVPGTADLRSCMRLASHIGASPIMPRPISWKLSVSEATALPSAGARRTLTLVSNTSAVGPQLGHALERARLQLDARAYVHQYEKYGVTADFIAERAELVQQVVDDYEGVYACSAAAAAAAATSARGEVSRAGAGARAAPIASAAPAIAARQ